MVSSKESPDFVACGGNGSFTTTWQRNVKSNTTAFDNRFTALLISVIFGNFSLGYFLLFLANIGNTDNFCNVQLFLVLCLENFSD